MFAYTLVAEGARWCTLGSTCSAPASWHSPVTHSLLAALLFMEGGGNASYCISDVSEKITNSEKMCFQAWVREKPLGACFKPKPKMGWVDDLLHVCVSDD